MCNLHEVLHWEELRKENEIKMNTAMILRNCAINYAFMSGCSQKEIANAIGLSESRIKKIIGEIKKDKQNDN